MGQQSQLLEWTMDRCRNCRVPCDGDYCCICCNLRTCDLCHRRLQARLFTLRESICDTCFRKIQHPTVRTALEGVVEEHEIRTTEQDGDLHVFMNEHENEILHILQRAVNQHRYEKFVVWISWLVDKIYGNNLVLTGCQLLYVWYGSSQCPNQRQRCVY